MGPIRTFMMAVLFFSASAITLWAQNACAYQFEAKQNQLVLPNGYFDLYIASERTSNPRYIDFSLKTQGIDNGYIFCLGIEQNGKMQCLDNLSEILTDPRINPVVIDNKRDTYFMFKEPDSQMDMLLSLVKRYVQNDALRLRLLQYVGSQPVDLCQDPSAELAIALKRFDIGYRIEHQIVENDLGSAEIRAKAIFDNPDGVAVVVADMFGGKKEAFRTTMNEFSLTVSENNSAGFCLSIDASPDDPNLKHESDYFCRTISIDRAADRNQLRRMLGGEGGGHVQLAKCAKEAKECEQPHLVLGASTLSRLQQAGYSVQMLQKNNEGSFIVAGPFEAEKFEGELAKIRQIHASAVRLGQAPAPASAPSSAPQPTVEN